MNSTFRILSYTYIVIDRLILSAVESNAYTIRIRKTDCHYSLRVNKQKLKKVNDC